MRREPWRLILMIGLGAAGAAAAYGLAHALPQAFGRIPFSPYLVIGALLTLYGGRGAGLTMCALSIAVWIADPPAGPGAIAGAALLSVPTVLFVHRHREAVSALRVSERRYAHLCELSSDIVLTDDLEGRVVSVSETGARLAGYAPAQVVGRSSLDFVVPEDRERAIQARERLLSREAETVSFDLRIVKADGSLIAADVRSGLATIDGRPVGFHTVARDVTERVRLEQQSRQRQKLEAIGGLAGGVAHDFNNLLTAIGGFVDLARTGVEAGHPAAGDLDEARRCCDQASEIVGQLLAFARRQELRPVVLETNQALAGLEPMLRRMLGQRIMFETGYAPDVGRIRVDPHQLTQVLLNLAVNARDAMPDGGRLSLVTREDDVKADDPARDGVAMAAGRYVVISVTDTGAGIDQATLAHIFEPFFTTKGEGQGTGLGLATVYGIVKQSGGYIWVDSDVGRGTRFDVFFPRVETEA